MPSVQADQAQYFYDALGRLVGVMDGSGELAVYTYDAVGNLLSIERFPAGGGGGGGVMVALLTPAIGTPGTEVTIRGVGFSAIPSDNQVFFNGILATVLSSTTTTIVAVVPTSATTGPITVTNSNGSALSSQPFTVSATQITGIVPDMIELGTTVEATITGVNLSHTTSVNFPSNGSIVIATVLGGSSESLLVRLTANTVGPVGNHVVSVSTPDGEVSNDSVVVTVFPPDSEVPVFPRHAFSIPTSVLNNRDPSLGPGGQPAPPLIFPRQAFSPSASILNDRDPSLGPGGQPAPPLVFPHQALSPPVSVLNGTP